jgi:DNA-directed RNA polymerase subunit RPC12/RpoP
MASTATKPRPGVSDSASTTKTGGRTIECSGCGARISVTSYNCIFCGAKARGEELMRKRAEERRKAYEKQMLKTQLPPTGGVFGSLALMGFSVLLMCMSVLGLLHINSGEVTIGVVGSGFIVSIGMFIFAINGLIGTLKIRKRLNS